VNKLTFYSAIFAVSLFDATAENTGIMQENYIPMGNDNLMQETPNDYGCKKLENALSSLGSNTNSIVLESEYRTSISIPNTRSYSDYRLKTNRIKKRNAKEKRKSYYKIKQP